jgi:hypothetical protein
MCKPFEAGFLYIFCISLLFSEGNVAKKVFHEACVGIVKVFFGYSPYRVLHYWLTLRMFLAVAGFYFRVEEASITAFHKWLLVHG